MQSHLRNTICVILDVCNDCLEQHFADRNLETRQKRYPQHGDLMSLERKEKTSRWDYKCGTCATRQSGTNDFWRATWIDLRYQKK